MISTEIAMLTGSQLVFLANIDRPRAFLRIFDKPGGIKRGRGQPSDDEKELLRAAVVFSIAALDAYLHDLVLEEVPKKGVHSQELTEAMRNIAREDPALSLRVALADSPTEGRAEFREALDDWLSTKSFQGPEAVQRTLALVGKPVKAATLAKALGDDWASELAHWTDMRHRMVHRAEKPYIRRRNAGACLRLVTNVAEAVDKIVVDGT